MPRQKKKLTLASFGKMKDNERQEIEENGYKFSVERIGKIYYLYNKMKELIFVDKDFDAIKKCITDYIRL